MKALVRNSCCVVPAFNARETISRVIEQCLDEVACVIVVIDGCTFGTGQEVKSKFADNPNVIIVERLENGGVGAATLDGFREAMARNFDYAVKVDADGQMPAEIIPLLALPVMRGEADIAKGNRFASPRHLQGMPVARKIGNAVLSLMSKVSSGYWSINDPTNGFLFIRLASLMDIEVGKLNRRFFFESDLLYRAGTAGLVVRDVPMQAVYPRGNQSNLSIIRSLITFPWLHLRNFVKRILFKYFWQQWSVASLELPIGIFLLGLGIGMGLDAYFLMGADTMSSMTAPQAVFVAISLISGLQLVLSVLHYDIETEPKNSQYRPQVVEDQEF